MATSRLKEPRKAPRMVAPTMLPAGSRPSAMQSESVMQSHHCRTRSALCTGPATQPHSGSGTRHACFH
eukprot:10508670-Alexandrium_andersonii.AAC.1